MPALIKTITRRALPIASVFALTWGAFAVPRVLPAQQTTGAQAASAQPVAITAEDLLKSSMDNYAKMTTFQAECKWALSYSGFPGMEAQRTIQYEKPNRFKIVSDSKMGMAQMSAMKQTAISDGSKLIEFSSMKEMGAQKSDAPETLASAHSMMLEHPMFGGTLLYKFFGGAGKYAQLVDAKKMAVSFGPPVTLDGQTCKTIKFWAQGYYGKTEVAIGEDVLVHRIRYGSEPLMEQTRKMMQSPDFQKTMQGMVDEAGKKASGGKTTAGKNTAGTGSAAGKTKANGNTKSGGKAKSGSKTAVKSNSKPGSADMAAIGKMIPTSTDTTELYSKVQVGLPIDASVFVAKAPEGVAEQEAGGGADTKPPVPLGSQAPDIALTGLDGTPRKLSEFRGKVVLIDFWATWCPPCRKGLPETQKLHADYGQKGLAVLAVSDEDKATVKSFITENKYTFPTYLDKNSAANKAYNIAAIPTTVVIDREGKLVAYMVGLSPKEDILAALQKAGLK